MFKRFFVLFTLFVAGPALILNCTGENDLNDSEGRFPLRGSYISFPPDPLNDRTNPLQTFIRNNWTNGDINSTAGLHYDHIKVMGHNWYDMGKLDDGEDQAEFAVDHFDLYVWGGPVVGDCANGQYQTFIWLSTIQGPYVGSAWDSTEALNWLADSTKNTEGYTWDDVTMHYKYDGTLPDPCNPCTDNGNYPGWNPVDDSNEDGCRDSAEASDSTRTAECITDAEIYHHAFNSGQQCWNYLKLMHEGTHEMLAGIMFDHVNSHNYTMRGEYHNNRGMFEYLDYGLQNSFTYENQDILTANSEYYLDKLLSVPTMAADYIEPEASSMKMHFCNMSSPYHICEKNSPSKDWVFEYIENFNLENWLFTGVSDQNLLMTSEMISDYLDCPLVNWLEKGKGIIFCVREDSPGSDRGKLFSLATFYMINHQMAFYCYVFNQKNWMNPNGEHVSVWNWNPYVEYYIGQPTVNTLGLNDFQGNPGTNRYFLWKDDDEYEILGREYLRDDSLRVLVLTKLMASGKNEGCDPTTHELPGCYRKVKSDLTLDVPTREITLRNNEGAILVATSDCLAPPVADFSADPVSGFLPLTIVFADLSTNVPTSWEWDFGDGDSSFDRNPQHTYEQEGSYTVSLTVTNDDGEDTETKTEYITVNGSGGGSKDIPCQP